MSPVLPKDAATSAASTRTICSHLIGRGDFLQTDKLRRSRWKNRSQVEGPPAETAPPEIITRPGSPLNGSRSFRCRSAVRWRGGSARGHRRRSIGALINKLLSLACGGKSRSSGSSCQESCRLARALCASVFACACVCVSPIRWRSKVHRCRSHQTGAAFAGLPASSACGAGR